MTGGGRRISLEMRADLVDRLERQVELTGIDRRRLIESAVEGLVRDFEQIDAEDGRPCTCGADGSRIERPHLSSCLKRPAEVAGVGDG